MIEAVICDYARTIVDVDVNPPRLYPEAEKVLEVLKARGLRLALVSRGQDPDLRKQEFEFLKLGRYFDVFKVVGPDGTKDFSPILIQLGVEPQKCVVIGDRVRSEIREGNKVGAITVWLRQGKFAGEEPENSEEEPRYTIDSIAQLVPVLDSLSSPKKD